MSATPTYLTDDLYNYLLGVSVRKNGLLEEGSQLTNDKIGIPMQSSPEQLNFLNWLIQTLKVKNVLEIGTYTGLSALAMAQALPDDGKIICLDHSDEFTTIARSIWETANVSNKIDLRIGKAVDSLKIIDIDCTDYFDLVFIDADKGNYQYYYDAVLPLLKVGGVVMIDNVLWSGRVLDEANQNDSTVAIRTFNEYLYNDTHVTITMLPFGDGLTLATKL